jgi:hypothetical protein
MGGRTQDPAVYVSGCRVIAGMGEQHRMPNRFHPKKLSIFQNTLNGLGEASTRFTIAIANIFLYKKQVLIF